MFEILASHGVNLMVAGVNHGRLCVTADNDATVRTALERAGIDFTEPPALPLRS